MGLYIEYDESNETNFNDFALKDNQFTLNSKVINSEFYSWLDCFYDDEGENLKKGDILVLNLKDDIVLHPEKKYTEFIDYNLVGNQLTIKIKKDLEDEYPYPNIYIHEILLIKYKGLLFTFECSSGFSLHFFDTEIFQKFKNLQVMVELFQKLIDQGRIYGKNEPWFKFHFG